MVVPVSKNESVLIIGAGCFGMSTAYHLLQRGFANVTVLDRSEVLPAQDAASNDMNRIARTSYSDIFYSQLARDAIQEWRKTDEWGDTYRECGVLLMGLVGRELYTSKSYTNDVALGVRTIKFDSGHAITRTVFPTDVKTGPAFEEDDAAAFLNVDSGWVDAGRGVAVLMARVIALGGKVVGGKTVTGLVREHGRTYGVTLADGSALRAGLVIIATGSWTASTFRELALDEMCTSTGQTVATIQLSQEEAARYRDVPVVIDFRSGFYIFPPTDDNIVKLARHDSGVVHCPLGDIDKPVSTPRTVLSHGDDGLRVPRSSLRSLRSELGRVYPELVGKPFAATRLCWYADSPDSDWVIGYYPSDPGVFLATSGSGHAYKFLPVIGRIVSDAIEGRLEPAISRKFAVDRKDKLDRFDHSRGLLRPADLFAEQLCTPEDLLPCIGEDDGGG